MTLPAIVVVKDGYVLPPGLVQRAEKILERSSSLILLHPPDTWVGYHPSELAGILGPAVVGHHDFEVRKVSGEYAVQRLGQPRRSVVRGKQHTHARRGHALSLQLRGVSSPRVR